MVCSEDLTNLLISLNMNNTGLISALKKHIVSKNSTHQMSAIQIISSILKHGPGRHAITILKSDVIEFLFEALMTDKTEQIEYVLECLFPLCQMDLFYTKCHSVYGIESILRVLNILMDMNNPDLIENAMVILSIVLKRHPESVPLFISSGTVHSCLAVITRGIKNCDPQIFCPSVTAFQGIIRKNHLLLPVPFEELKEMLKILSEEIWQHMFSVSAPIKSKNKIMIKETYKPAEEFLQVCLSCTSLVEQCSEDPAASLSNFTGATAQQVKRSDHEFKEFVISICVDSAISCAMKNLDEEDNPVLYELVLTLLCHLYELNTEKTCQVLIRLTSAGFLTKVMELKSSSSCDRVTGNKHMVDKFLSMVCEALHRSDDKEVPLPNWIETGLHNVNYKFEELPQILTKLDVDNDTLQIYLFLLYHIYRQDHIPMQANTLEEFLISSTDLLDRQPQLSPLVVKYFIFLWSFASCLSENQNEDSMKVVEFITKITTDIEPHVWYTHHPALLYWSCQDVILCKVFGTKIMELWIEGVTEKWSEADIVDLTPDFSDFQSIYEMFTSLDFIEIFMELFISSSERVIKVAAQILYHIINQVMESNSKDVFFHHLNNQIKELLQEAFLHHTTQCVTETKINCLLSVLIKSYKEEMSELDAEDIKVLHHVIKWLSTECTVEVLQSCLQLLCVYCQSQCISSGNSVILLVIQNEEAIGNLDSLSKHPDRTVRVLTTKIVTELINYQSKNPTVHKSHSRRVTISLQPLEDKLNTNNLLELEATLQLLTALFTCKFRCQLVSLQNTALFVADMTCPLVSADFNIMFSYLQQHILQDIPDIRSTAVDCLTGMINYLEGTQSNLANHLITHPWNTLLMEILIQTTDDITITTTVKFFQMILDFASGKALLVKSPYLVKNLSKLLKNSSMREKLPEIESLFSKLQ